MKRSAYRSFDFLKISRRAGVFALAAIALIFSPQVFAQQHPSGGHAGGTNSGGGGTGFGGAHMSSPPPAPMHIAPPAPSPIHVMTPPPPAPIHIMTPPAPAPIHMMAPPAPVQNPSPAFHGPAFGARPGNQPFVSVAPAAPVTPAAENPAQNSLPPIRIFSNPGRNPGRTPGAPLSFSGQGHEIWRDGANQNAPSSVPSSVPSSMPFSITTAGPAATTPPSRDVPTFAGRMARAPFETVPAATPAAPPHIFSPPHHTRPIIFNPGFGYGFGYGSPYFFEPFYGFQYGSVWVPCNNAGIGFLCAPFNYDYGFEQPYNSIMIPGTTVQSSTGEIFSPYSLTYNSPDENSEASPVQSTGQSAGQPTVPPSLLDENGKPLPEYLLYLKDGAVYVVSDFWLDHGRLMYFTASGGTSAMNLDALDFQKTVEANNKRGLDFVLRSAPEPAAPPASSEPAPPPNQN